MFRWKDKLPQFSQDRKKELRKQGFIYVWLLALVVAVCSQQKIQGLFMDDMLDWNAWYRYDSYWDYAWGMGAYKIRPVIGFLMGFGFLLAGPYTQLLWYWLVFVNYVTVLVIYHIFRALVKADWLVLLASTVYVLSRFGYYAYGQYFGIMEQTATVFAALVLYQVLKAIDSEKPDGHLLLATLFSVIAVFCHERYMALLVLVMIASVFIRGSLKKRLLYLAGNILMLAAILVLRSAVFGDNAWAGTGGTDMVSNLDVVQVIKHIVKSILLLLGFNIHATYLGGYAWFDVPVVIYVINVIALGVMFYFFVSTLRNHKLKDIWKKYFLLIAFIGGTTVVCCTTIRLELRWLYTPFVGVLLLWQMLIEDGTVAESRPQIKKTLPAAALVCMIVMELFFHTGYGNLYMWDTQNVYNQLYEKTWQKNSYDLEGKRIVVISNGMEHVTQGEIDIFFDTYAVAHGQTPPEVTVYEEVYDMDYTGREDIILSVEVTKDPLQWLSTVDDVTLELRQLPQSIENPSLNIRDIPNITGIYDWEGESVWSGGRIAMDITTGLKGKAKLRAHCPAFNLPNNLQVYFDGHLIQTVALTEEGVDIAFTLPSYAEGQLELVLEKANVPAEIGAGADERELGICIYDFTVK